MSSRQQVALAAMDGATARQTKTVQRLKAKLKQKGKTPLPPIKIKAAGHGETKADEDKKKYAMKELPEDAKAQLAQGQADLKNKLAYTQNTVALMRAKLKKEGLSNKDINRAINDHAIEVETAVKNKPNNLNPSSGMLRDTAIRVTHYMQELMLLKDISALPLRAYMSKFGDRYYDEYFVMRKTTDPLVPYKMTTVWFDVTAVHEEIKRVTGREPIDRPYAGLTSCSKCKKPNEQGLMPKCKRCKSVVYCDINCAKANKAAHKPECEKVQAEIKAGQDTREETEAKEEKKEHQASKNNEDWRFFNFAMPTRFNALVKKYKQTVIDVADLFTDEDQQPSDKGVFQLGMLYESKMDSKTAVEKLQEEQLFDVVMNSVGVRPSRSRNEPKGCEVLFVNVSDVLHGIHGCLLATGGTEVHPAVPIQDMVDARPPIQLTAEVAFVKRGTARKYFDLAYEAKEMQSMLSRIPSDKRNEYLTNCLRSNEEMAGRFKYDIKSKELYQLKDPGTYELLNTIAMNDGVFTISTVFTARGGQKMGKLGGEQVQLKPRKVSANVTLDLADEDKQPIVFMPKEAPKEAHENKGEEFTIQVEDADAVVFDKLRVTTRGLASVLSADTPKEGQGKETPEEQKQSKVLSPTAHVSFA